MQKKQGQELDCAVKIGQQSRIEAYEKFFKTKPNDAAGQKFNDWVEATGYIGRRFKEITSEENFDEESQLGVTLLSRSITSTAPGILLSGQSKYKVVTRASVLSQPNPSPEYIHSVVDTLSKAWGSPSGGDGITTWTWTTKGFTSNLVLDPVSANGPFLALATEAK